MVRSKDTDLGAKCDFALELYEVLHTVKLGVLIWNLIFHH